MERRAYGRQIIGEMLEQKASVHGMIARHFCYHCTRQKSEADGAEFANTAEGLAGHDRVFVQEFLIKAYY